MLTRRIGPFHVAPIAMGCMNFNHAYGKPPTPGQAERLLLQALEAGVTLFDTAALYGFGANEALVGRVLKPHRGRIVLCSKGGMAGEPQADGSLQRVIDGRPAAIRRHCEASLQRLQTDHIDLYYLHRWDKKVPIEESVGAMVDLQREGKIGALGLSEVSAATLRRARAVHEIAAVQSEYSPWTRNPEIAVLRACAEEGTAFVAFSPLARGFLTASPPDPAQLEPQDLRRTMPRFEPAAHAANLALWHDFAGLAQQAGITPAQLSLAWVLSKGEQVIALPGTTDEQHLQENLAAGALRLSPAWLAQVDALLPPARVAGARYSPAAQADVDTEEFAPPAS
ncbi:MAG TPA: aldo/keto reductase [Rubrivivax sp.]|nr:aldo/keto reductase [Rubrivivax sp.]